MILKVKLVFLDGDPNPHQLDQHYETEVVVDDVDEAEEAGREFYTLTRAFGAGVRAAAVEQQ